MNDLEINDLELRPKPCKGCGKIFTPTIPFEEGDVYGMKVAPHGCPPAYNRFVATSRDANVRRLFKSLVGAIDKAANRE